MKKRNLILAFLTLLLTFNVKSKTMDSKKINIVTSVKYLKDLIRNVTCGDESLKIDVLIPDGANPHTFHLDAKNKLRILNAKLLLLIHPDLEGWSLKLNKTSKFYLGKHLPLTEMSHSHSCSHSHKDEPHDTHDTGKASNSHSHDHNHNDEHHDTHDTGKASNSHSHDHHHNYDIHIWHSIDLTQKSLKIILEELIKLQPEKKELYSKCTQDSSAKIEALRKKLKRNLASIPKDKRVIAIPHNSLNYLGEEFDIKIIPISENGHFNIAHPNELVKVINSIKEKKIQALFYDDVSPKKIVDLVSKEAKLKIAGTLASDSYSSRYNITNYMELWTYNIDTIAKALK